MSCHYKFKTTVTFKNGATRSLTTESFTFTRADCRRELKKLATLKKLHVGQQILKDLLTEALAKPGLGSITIELNRKK